jgi:hypothetical protein
LLFVDLGVEGPVLGLVAACFGAPGEDNGGVGLRNEDYSSEEGSGSHDEGDPLRPAPAEVRLGDEAADNRT